jgi:hypothetical protein
MSKTFTIKGRWNGRRNDGRACAVIVLSEWEEVPPGYGQVASTRNHVKDHIKIDDQLANRLEKGKYQIVETGEIVTCAHPSAP